MKTFVQISRYFVGALFIFSGLVKAIDPKGLAYKMEEFFDVWGKSGFASGLMESLTHQSLYFSIAIITLEVLLGIALIIGWKRKFVLSALLLLTLFFTFLTAFVLFSNKIKECGCFGNCIPLTPVQTFVKDLVLLGLILLLIWKQHLIQPLFRKVSMGLILGGGVLVTLLLQWFVLWHLPIVDCLPYKVGNNIAALRKMPANAIKDSFDLRFVYEKGGVVKEFGMNDLPDDTWTFKDRKQVLVKKGSNNIPPISDFFLFRSDGTDATDAILNQPQKYYLLFVKEVPQNQVDTWLKKLQVLSTQIGTSLYIVSAQPTLVREWLQKNGILFKEVFTADGVLIKTVARANPVLLTMQGPVISQKLSWANFDKVK